MTNHFSHSLPTSRRRLQMQIGIGLLLSFFLWTLASGLSAADPENDAAVKRTRKQVKMLDDLYKTAVVLITQHYVTEDSDLPAGTAAKALFAAMKQKGWHEVRLVDATGEPLNDENSPKDSFEKKSIAKLLAGETWIEEVVKKDKKRHLRVTTAVPVVLKKCTMCHENYKNLPRARRSADCPTRFRLSSSIQNRSGENSSSDTPAQNVGVKIYARDSAEN